MFGERRSESDSPRPAPPAVCGHDHKGKGSASWAHRGAHQQGVSSKWQSRARIPGWCRRSTTSDQFTGAHRELISKAPLSLRTPFHSAGVALSPRVHQSKPGVHQSKHQSPPSSAAWSPIRKWTESAFTITSEESSRSAAACRRMRARAVTGCGPVSGVHYARARWRSTRLLCKVALHHHGPCSCARLRAREGRR